MSIQESRNDMCNQLRAMTTVEQYYELIHYGNAKQDIEIQDINGKFNRILVFDYYGSIWFMQLCNGEIVKIEEL